MIMDIKMLLPLIKESQFLYQTPHAPETCIFNQVFFSFSNTINFVNATENDMQTLLDCVSLNVVNYPGTVK